MDLFGKDLICEQEWSKEELMKVLHLAAKLKRGRHNEEHRKILRDMTFLMFFYNPSLRTRQSFEIAIQELGGYGMFLQPSAMRLKSATTRGETVEDAAKVMSRYACGIGMRILEDKVTKYGEGNQLLRDYAKHSTVPIINMADDRFHPCQALADVMGWAEWYGEGPGRPDYEALKGKKFVLQWASGGLARSWCSVNSALLIASRFGMDVTVARPEGYDLDPEVYEWSKKNCEENGRKFETTDKLEDAYKGAHIVYSRNWVSPEAYSTGQFDKKGEIEKSLKKEGWCCSQELMNLSDNAIYTHPMPIERGCEVTDEVASGPRSAIYDVAENRLHVQKAVMALTCAEDYIA